MTKMARLVFLHAFGMIEQEEAKSRGYLSHVLVEVDNGLLYPVFFYDAVRLKQDLDEEAKLGRPFVADPGMIVLLSVTQSAMEAAVQTLNQEGFFGRLQPVTREQLEAASPSYGL